jgi:hypothetical protein
MYRAGAQVKSMYRPDGMKLHMFIESFCLHDVGIIVKLTACMLTLVADDEVMSMLG